jgi:hypothetical protein
MLRPLLKIVETNNTLDHKCLEGLGDVIPHKKVIYCVTPTRFNSKLENNL